MTILGKHKRLLAPSDRGGKANAVRSDYGTTVPAPTGHTVGKFDRSKFHIGTYCYAFGSRTEEMIQAIGACGLDFVASNQWGGKGTVEEMDAFLKNGVGVITDDRDLIGHPACIAIDVIDEPNLNKYPEVNQKIEKNKEEFPDRFSYVNLFPKGCTFEQLGGTYEEYIDAYVKNVNTDYICYDHYAHGGGSPVAEWWWYNNLKVVADACTKSDRSLWVVMQGFGGPTNASARGSGDYLSADCMRVQVYSAMAFGAECINWTTWAGGWGSTYPEENGALTPLYDTWKAINAEIHGFCDEYMKYRRMATTYVCSIDPNTLAPENLQWEDGEHTSVLNAGVFADFTPAVEKHLLVGEMTPRNGDGSSALMIAEVTDFYGANKDPFEVTFKTIDSRTVKAYQGKNVTELAPDADGVYHLTVNPYAGILLVAERK